MVSPELRLRGPPSLEPTQPPIALHASGYYDASFFVRFERFGRSIYFYCIGLDFGATYSCVIAYVLYQF